MSKVKLSLIYKANVKIDKIIVVTTIAVVTTATVGTDLKVKELKAIDHREIDLSDSKENVLRTTTALLGTTALQENASRKANALRATTSKAAIVLSKRTSLPLISKNNHIIIQS